MPLPCPPDHAPPPPGPHVPGACVYCWMYANNPHYRAARSPGGKGGASAPVVKNHGPGTELKALLASLGLTPSGCQCESRARLMDAGGAAWCREHRHEILEWLREEQSKRGWAELAGAAWKALSGGLPLSAEGLLDEAIRRAEIKAGEPPRSPGGSGEVQ